MNFQTNSTDEVTDEEVWHLNSAYYCYSKIKRIL